MPHPNREDQFGNPMSSGNNRNTSARSSRDNEIRLPRESRIVIYIDSSEEDDFRGITDTDGYSRRIHPDGPW